jgi:hypothetical protein
VKQKTIENTLSLFPEEDRMNHDFKRALQLTKKYYGNYPGPTELTYNFCLDVSNFFKKMGVRAEGVITVAIGSDKKRYLGLSRKLDQNACSSDGYFKFGPDLKAILGDFVFCKNISDDIIAKAKDKGKDNANLGCAEQKAVSSIYLAKQKLIEISVVAHPDTKWTQGSPPATVVAEGTDGTFIAPCETCRAIYHG